MKLFLAGDIGGTKLAAGVVREDGLVLSTCAEPTPAGPDAENLYALLRMLLERAWRESGIEAAPVAIGIGCGGPMRLPEGFVSPLNVPAWRDFPLRSRLQADFRVPVRVDNDAKAFALGEYWIGAGKGSRCLLAMVISTGVGGGVVENGHLIDGAHGNAGHIGHVPVDRNGPLCACGARGCLEAIASGTSLAATARQLVKQGRASRISVDGTAAEIAAAAGMGDALAIELYEQAGKALGRAIAAAAVLFDLDRVVIGGSVSRSARYFLPSLRRELAASAQLDFTRGLEVTISADTVVSALAGAARLAVEGPGQSSS